MATSARRCFAHARLVLTSIAFAGGCVGAVESPSADRTDNATSSAATVGGVDQAHGTCAELPPGISGSPSTIAQTVGLVNALLAARPPSLSLACFVQRLDRPLVTLGVQSTFSLQPADGPRSPRVFIFSGTLVMSVAAGGSASDRLELAEYPSPLRSIKAEIAFPVNAPVPLAEPYDRIRLGDGTTCGVCHRDERPAPEVSVTKAFESGVFNPRPQDVVPLPYMQDQAGACDPAQEPFRCALLNALFENGTVETGAFAPGAPTIFD